MLDAGLLADLIVELPNAVRLQRLLRRSRFVAAGGRQPAPASGGGFGA